jgi:DNA topoisomerase-2
MEVIKYNDFVNRELILFSMADLSRSIPSVVDGLKPSQRKILFCAFKRNFVIQAKVIMNCAHQPLGSPNLGRFPHF